MKQLRKQLGDKKGKYAAVAALYAGAAAITCLGAWYAAYSVANHVTLKVLGADVPGLIFAALAAYFGIRSFFQVKRLAKEVLKDSSFFSWSNFKRAKPTRGR